MTLTGMPGGQEIIVKHVRWRGREFRILRAANTPDTSWLQVVVGDNTFSSIGPVRMTDGHTPTLVPSDRHAAWLRRGSTLAAGLAQLVADAMAESSTLRESASCGAGHAAI